MGGVSVCCAGRLQVQSCVIPAFGLVKSAYVELQVLVQVGIGCLVMLVLPAVALCFSEFPLC